MPDNKPVVFLMPDGTEVSNDPRFFESQMAKQIAGQQGIPADTGQTSSSADDEPVELPENFEELKGAELKALAKDLKSKGVEIATAGVTTVVGLREAIQEGFDNYDPDAEEAELEDEES